MNWFGLSVGAPSWSTWTNFAHVVLGNQFRNLLCHSGDLVEGKQGLVTVEWRI